LRFLPGKGQMAELQIGKMAGQNEVNRRAVKRGADDFTQSEKRWVGLCRATRIGGALRVETTRGPGAWAGKEAVNAQGNSGRLPGLPLRGYICVKYDYEVAKSADGSMV